MPITNWEQLNKLLTEALSSYNDLIAAMNLVLFEDAMMHICRYYSGIILLGFKISKELQDIRD